MKISLGDLKRLIKEAFEGVVEAPKVELQRLIAAMDPEEVAK